MGLNSYKVKPFSHCKLGFQNRFHSVTKALFPYSNTWHCMNLTYGSHPYYCRGIKQAFKKKVYIFELAPINHNKGRMAFTFCECMKVTVKGFNDNINTFRKQLLTSHKLYTYYAFTQEPYLTYCISKTD